MPEMQPEKLECSAATDELHDFIAVAGFDARFLPFRARQDFQIALDGHAARIEPQLTKQIGDGGSERGPASLPVDGNGDGRFHS